jgi:hypothetical protein
VRWVRTAVLFAAPDAKLNSYSGPASGTPTSALLILRGKSEVKFLKELEHRGTWKQSV